jgi:hypothetical protein
MNHPILTIMGLALGIAVLARLLWIGAHVGMPRNRRWDRLRTLLCASRAVRYFRRKP